MKLPSPPLLLITDRRLAARPLVEMAAAAFEGGCRWISLREKDLAAEERAKLLGEIGAFAAPVGAVVTVHDDVDGVGPVDGIHLPRTGSPAEARRRLGSHALIGYSAHDVGEAERAAREGADYVTLSPIFLTASKPGYGPALGLPKLHNIASRLSIPVIALGGIEPNNAADCLSAGAAGIAVMGSVMRAHNPAAMIADLLRRSGLAKR